MLSTAHLKPLIRALRTPHRSVVDLFHGEFHESLNQFRRLSLQRPWPLRCLLVTALPTPKNRIANYLTGSGGVGEQAHTASRLIAGCLLVISGASLMLDRSVMTRTMLTLIDDATFVGTLGDCCPLLRVPTFPVVARRMLPAGNFTVPRPEQLVRLG